MLSSVLSEAGKDPKPGKLDRAMKIFDTIASTGELGMSAYDLKLKRDELSLMKAKKAVPIKTDTVFEQAPLAEKDTWRQDK